MTKDCTASTLGGTQGVRTGHVLDLEAIDRTQVEVAGGKGAHLGELTRLEGIHVPAGFCVTTDAFERTLENASLGEWLERLACLEPHDQKAIGMLAAEIRQILEGLPLPDDLALAIRKQLDRLGEQGAYAVRSSATVEDSPGASFAGQFDSFLNVVGPEAILRHINRCWASLFTERALAYRLRKGLDPHKVRMAVIVQQMVQAEASGVMFTADPVTGNRKFLLVEACPGPGEALVSGRVNADVYRVREGRIVERVLGSRHPASRAVLADGPREHAVEPGRRALQGKLDPRGPMAQPVLEEEQVLRLTRLGQRIEAHFGCPQDIEWCLIDDRFYIVQCRPITTLFPIPVSDDQENRVYVSVGHGQMMTDPMKPLGLSVWKLTTPRPMVEAGGRLFVDVTPDLASPASRADLLAMMGKGDPLIGDALRTLVERGDFVRVSADEGPGTAPAAVFSGAAQDPIEADPGIVAGLIERSQASLAALKREIRTRSGMALLDFILADIQELRRLLFDPHSLQVIKAAMEAAWWLNDKLYEWLGEKNAADTLSRSVPHNITSEMGLALLDVADTIRPHPEVVAFLKQIGRHSGLDSGQMPQVGQYSGQVPGQVRASGKLQGQEFRQGQRTSPQVAREEGFLDTLIRMPGGREARNAIQAFLARFGMRCVGEIDITRPRWSERPETLVPLILGHIEKFEAGEARRHFELGRRQARQKERDLLARLRALPDGERKAEETRRMIARLRTFAGYREYPKYGMVSRYFVYKQALLQEADRLVSARVLSEREDIFYLTFEELGEVVRTERVDHELIRRRKVEFESYHALTPPRVITSEGEVIRGRYRRDGLPDGALAGLPVSAGIVEGRARVILDLSEADLEPGDILVTTFTDPSWTPLFVAIRGLVTEVGGLMTHGAVIAREYGLPAVVAVEHATRLIRDGQRIRLNGTEGYIEILA